MRNPIRSKVTSIVNRSLDPQEWFWVQFRIPPPLKLAKTLSLHFDQPRQAPSLAGFFTWACGLGRPPQGLILAFLTRFSSLFLYSLRPRKPPTPQASPRQNKHLSPPAAPGGFFFCRGQPCGFGG